MTETQERNVFAESARVLADIQDVVKKADEIHSSLAEAQRTFRDEAANVEKSVAQAAGDVRSVNSELMMTREQITRATREVLDLAARTEVVAQKVSRLQTAVWILSAMTTLLALALFFGRLPL